jgi:L-asparaginase
MAKPKIAVFSGPRSTVANSPTLVTSNKGRLSGERVLPGRFDHLTAQRLYEPVKIKIKKYTAHPLEEDAKEVYHDNGKDYWEVELLPEDGPYLLPYVARRADSSPDGVPFEDSDLLDAALNYGGRQFFYPDASGVFEHIDRSIAGRDEHGEGSTLDRLADFEFIRALPPAGYTQQGEVIGKDFFPYKPIPLSSFPPAWALARVVNVVQAALATGQYAGAIWLEGSPHVEETTYWLSLLLDSDLPFAGVASQRPHGTLANDGDRNIVDAVEYVLSGVGVGLGAVGVMDQQLFAAREFKKGDARPGGYKATGGHGGVLGTVGPPVTVWYTPAYKRMRTSDVNLSRLPAEVEFFDTTDDATAASVTIKNTDGTLREDVIPKVHLAKYGHYMAEDETGNPDHEVDIMARIEKGITEEKSGVAPFHGFVVEGGAGTGNILKSQEAALAIAAYSGMPVVRVSRADPWGPLAPNPNNLTIEGSNLDTNKARVLLRAAMLKLGRLPKARDPRKPNSDEREAVLAKIVEFQEIFSTH